mgnify:CR=1 FL=1
MTEIFGVPIQALLGQLMLGLVNGSFYAMLSLGLAVIFGLLNIINFTHGAMYMMGAYVAWMSLSWWGIGYWWSLALAPLIVGAFGMIIERLPAGQRGARRGDRRIDVVCTSLRYAGQQGTGGRVVHVEGVASRGLRLRPWPVRRAGDATGSGQGGRRRE